ncbi:MAG TPA: hypothetical protein VFA65_14240 [Bryobacteraceae bacterium]|nr:hypothetical protein [Bryobacteraceae bacterium]
MLDVLDKIMMHPRTPRSAARTVERIVRASKAVRVAQDRARRRKLVSSVPRDPKFTNLLDPARGFGWIPKGTMGAVGPAVAYAQRVLEERRHIQRPRKEGKQAVEDYLIHLFVPTRYEEAPPLFDLALSNEVLQIATEYLGELPVLLRVQLLWSPVNSRLKGSQLYHRDGRHWFQQRVKFIFAANDIDESSGPFTFLPADLSEQVSKRYDSFRMLDRVKDEDMYRYVSPSDELQFVGPAGSGLVLDTSRCFHFGSRTRGKERLLIMFQFWSPLDLPPGRGVNLLRSPEFTKRFGSDPIHMLLIPDDDKADSPIRIETD